MLRVASKPKKFYSPLRYPGGKSSLTDFLVQIIAKNDLWGCTYVEPYAGGAGAALSLLILEKVDRIIINDLDKSIHSFWTSILHDTERFIEKIQSVELNMKEWHTQREIYKDKPDDHLELGFAAFYMNRTNRSGIIEGGVIGGVKQTGKWGIDARFNRDGLISRIRKISQYRNRIDVTCRDGIELINGIKKQRNVLVYIDPPYFVKGGSLYLNHYKKEDHVRLSNILNKNSAFNWLLTYDNVVEIQELYVNRRSFEFSLNYHADKAKLGHELLILSDNLEMV